MTSAHNKTIFKEIKSLKNWMQRPTWRSLFPPPAPPPRLFPITVTVFQSSDIFLQDFNSAISLNDSLTSRAYQETGNIYPVLTLSDGHYEELRSLYYRSIKKDNDIVTMLAITIRPRRTRLISGGRRHMEWIGESFSPLNNKRVNVMQFEMRETVCCNRRNL